MYSKLCLKFLGHLGLLCTFVTPFAKLHISPFQVWIKSVYRPAIPDMSVKVLIPDQILSSTEWGMIEGTVRVVIPYTPWFVSKTLIIDASKMGWVKHLYRIQAHGLWSNLESMIHINVLELRAVTLVCKAFLPSIKNSSSSHRQFDSYLLLRQGGTTWGLLWQQAIKLWKWCI